VLYFDLDQYHRNRLTPISVPSPWPLREHLLAVAMPYYEIQHSYPLETKQKRHLAEAITHLHSTTFVMPSMFGVCPLPLIHFRLRQLNTLPSNPPLTTHAHTLTSPSPLVNISFTPVDATENNYFVGGTARPNACNRILGLVRQSPSRTKADLDKLAEKIESAWYDVVTGEVVQEGQGDKSQHGRDIGKRRGVDHETTREKDAKKLMFVMFHPLLAVRETGVAMPGVSTWGSWPHA